MAQKAVHVLAIDQGTTSSRAIVFSADLSVLAVAQQEFPQHFPASGWVEHDPADIWSSTAAVTRAVIEKAGLRGADLAAIGITNQRETTVIWDRATGQPIHNAIVWQDRRTADTCAALKAEGLEGLRANPEPGQAPRVLAELERLAKANPSPYGTGYVESLRTLVTALAERDPHAAPKSAGLRQRVGAAPKMNAREVERTHIIGMKQLEADREAARAAKAAAAAPAPVRGTASKGALGAGGATARRPASAPAPTPAPPPPPKAPAPDLGEGLAPMSAREAERTHIVQSRNIEAQRAARPQKPSAAEPSLPSDSTRRLRG